MDTHSNQVTSSNLPHILISHITCVGILYTVFSSSGQVLGSWQQLQLGAGVEMFCDGKAFHSLPSNTWRISHSLS